MDENRNTPTGAPSPQENAALNEDMVTPAAADPPDDVVALAGEPASPVEVPVQDYPRRRPFAVRLFIGPNGLRAGWRFLIYIILVVAFGALVNRVMRAIGHRHRTTEITAWGTVISDAILFTIVLVPSLFMGAFEKRSLANYYLPLRHAFGRRFWEGALWGFAALTVLLIGIRATGDFYFGQVELSGARLLYYAAVWGLAFIMVGLAEEYALRGYSMFTLASGMGFWPAALILSIVFALLHRGNPGETPVGLFDIIAIALFFCLTLRLTGNLWFAIGFHAAWDWGETFFYGVPNSGMIPSGHLLAPQFHGSRWITGGSAGPEGSVFSLVLTCALAALITVRFGKERTVRSPDWRRAGGETPE